jgi:molybdate transport system substrate-binding protein
MVRVLVGIAALVAALMAGGRNAAAQTLTIAAASDLQSVLPEIAGRYEKATGTRVRVSFGSSGNFFAQIQNGAPFDLFFSADVGYPRRLEQAGRVERGSVRLYAIGRLVLWTRKGSRVDVRRGLAVLTEGSVRTVAIANPDVAPYGRAAVAALRHEGLFEQVQGKLVRGENVSQAAQFADSGNADAGVFSESLARSPAMKGRGTFVEIPAAYHPPIEQAVAIVSTSANKARARAFLDYLQQDDIKALMTTAGFTLPASAPVR